MSKPSTATRPAVGVTSPQTMLMSVVLPAPLGPRSAKISPLEMSRLTAFRACSPEAYVFVRPETEMMGAVAMERAVYRADCRRPLTSLVMRLLVLDAHHPADAELVDEHAEARG